MVSVPSAVDDELDVVPPFTSPLVVNGSQLMGPSVGHYHHNQRIALPPPVDKLPDFKQRFTLNHKCRQAQKCTDLLASLLSAYDASKHNYNLLQETIRSTLTVENDINR